uniref:Uncharacterized protein n=1 Tax=Strigamia maritima TaxID=126957 RepID=T1JF99_STRMM
MKKKCSVETVGRETTSWVVMTVWLTVSVAAVSMSTISFLQPAWFVRQEKKQSKEVDDIFMFGVFSFCYRVDSGYNCQLYQGVLRSTVWQICGVFYGGGCVLNWLCTVLAFLVIAMPSMKLRRQVITGIALSQAVSVILMIIPLVVYPLDLGSPFVRRICGDDSAPFSPGSCSVGWSYALAVVATGLSIYCPLLAWLTTYKAYKVSYTSLWTKEYSKLHFQHVTCNRNKL